MFPTPSGFYDNNAVLPQSLKSRIETASRSRQTNTRTTSYNPGGRGHVGQSAEDHYDWLAKEGTLTQEERKRGLIAPLRSFHNWVKEQAFQRNTHKGSGLHIDLGSGRGGDFLKWQRAKQKFVLAMDISGESLVQLKERRDEFKRSKPHLNVPFIETQQADLGDDHSNDIVECSDKWLKGQEFTSASSMFVMHYMADTKQRMANVFRNASCKLCTGGKFFGTFTDGDSVLERLQNVGKIIIPADTNNNSDDAMKEDEKAEDGPLLPTKAAGRMLDGEEYYKVYMDKETYDASNNSSWGQQISFTLAEAVENVPEYLTFSRNLVNIAADFGLVPCNGGFQKFETLYMYYNMTARRSASPLPPVLKEVSFLYTMFIFIRESVPVMDTPRVEYDDPDQEGSVEDARTPMSTTGSQEAVGSKRVRNEEQESESKESQSPSNSTKTILESESSHLSTQNSQRIFRSTFEEYQSESYASLRQDINPTGVKVLHGAVPECLRAATSGGNRHSCNTVEYA